MKRLPGREHFAAIWLLGEVGRTSSRIFDKLLEPAGLRVRHVPLLSTLRAGTLSQRHLGAALAMRPAALVGVLNELETEGLIVRRRDPSDRRRHDVSLSELGHARLAALDVAREKLEAIVFRDVGSAQRALLGGLLDRIAGNLGIASEPAKFG